MALPSDDVAPDDTSTPPNTTTRTPSSSRPGGGGGNTEASHVVTAYVVEPGGACSRYRWDADSGIPILEGVLHPVNARGVDLARVPLLPSPPTRARTPGESVRRRASWIEPLVDDSVGELLAGLGPSLLVLVVAHPSNPPGTRLSVRLLGAVHIAAGQGDRGVAHADAGDTDADLSEWIAVAVPTADPMLAQVERVSDLQGDLRWRLRHALATIAEDTASESGSAQPPGLWLSADQVMERLQEARARGRLEARATDAAARGQLRERLYVASPETVGGATEGETFRRRLARDAASSSSAQAAPMRQPPAQPPAQPVPGTWREITPVSPAELRARGAAVYGESEHLARWIPTRFARYLGELLLPDERVLFFAECPPLTIRGWTGSVAQGHGVSGGRSSAPSRHSPPWSVGRALDRWRTRHLQSGIFLITDRQALLLRDYAAPDATMVQWGYVAHSIPLARLLAVRVMPPHAILAPMVGSVLASWPDGVEGEHPVGIASYDEVTVPDQFARIGFALEGAKGIELTGAALPPESTPVLQRAAAVLECFTPLAGSAGTGDRRMRLVHAVGAWKPTAREAAELESLGGLVPPDVSEALEAATRDALEPGDTVLAQARTPREQEASADTAALLTLTATRLLVARSPHTSHTARHAESPASSAPVTYPSVALQQVPLRYCTSVTLQHSLLGCGLACAVPSRTNANHQYIESIHIAFPSPLIVPFRAFYNRLRLLLGNVPTT